MALSRKFLTALGIEADKVDEIINAHSETVDALKEERDSFKAQAEKLEKTEAELAAARKEIAEAGKEDTYKLKYEALKDDFDSFKKNIETEKANATKADAYKQLLKEIGISEKRVDAVARLADLEKLNIQEDGTIEGAEELKKSLAEEWADFIPTKGEEGAKTPTPPAGGGGTVKTKKEIMEIKDTAERQAAWAEYLTQNGGN